MRGGPATAVITQIGEKPTKRLFAVDLPGGFRISGWSPKTADLDSQGNAPDFMEDPGSKPVSPFYKPLGKRIRAARKAMGMSQELLGWHLGVGQSTVSEYESGRLGLDVETLVHIAKLLEVPVSDLLEGPKKN